MDDRELQQILGEIRDAQIIWADVRGGKLDGKFVPIWLNDALAAQLDAAVTSVGVVVVGCAYVFRVDDAAIAEIMRQNVLRVKGPSAVWPAGVELERGYAGGYVARRTKNCTD